MDQSQDLAWWAEVVFGEWSSRPGPRYQRLAACLRDAVSRRVLVPGTRVPAERQLAMVAGVSRGTVVACFEHLVAAGVLRRQVGAGTFVVGPPSWASAVRDSGRGVAELLLRRLAGDLQVIDLSVSCPGDVRHLPAVASPSLAELDGNGLDPRGLLSLRSAVAAHLTRFGRLPTSADQIVICAGAQEALWLLGRVLRPPRVLVSCPSYPGITGAFGSRVSVVPGDVAGTTAVEVARAPGGSCGYVMPDGHNPTGLVMSGVRRQAFASVADAERGGGGRGHGACRSGAVGECLDPAAGGVESVGDRCRVGVQAAVGRAANRIDPGWRFWFRAAGGLGNPLREPSRRRRVGARVTRVAYVTNVSENRGYAEVWGTKTSPKFPRSQEFPPYSSSPRPEWPVSCPGSMRGAARRRGAGRRCQAGGSGLR